MQYNGTAVLDYVDFKITVKKLIGSRPFANKYSVIQQKYARKDAMIEKGQLSKAQSEKVAKDKANDIANLYSEFVVSDWSGVWKNADDKVVYDFNKNKATPENIKEFCLKDEHQDMVVDIVEQATTESNFVKEQEEKEEENVKKS